MSSHHVIRDEQEPPLIILDENFELETINELLGWSPLLIVEVSLVKFFNARQIKVDGTINLLGADQHVLESPQAIVAYDLTPDKSKLLQSLLTILQGKDYTGINIFCNTATKAILLEGLKFIDKLPYPLNIFVQEKKTIIAFKQLLNKWYPAGQKLSYDAELISCKRSMKQMEGFFQIIEEGSYTFTTNERFMAITEF